MSFSLNWLGLGRWLAPFYFSSLSLEMELRSHKSENLIHPLDNFTRHNSTGIVWIRGINCYISIILRSLIAYMFCCLYVFLRWYVFVSQMISICLLENMYLSLCLFLGQFVFRPLWDRWAAKVAGSHSNVSLSMALAYMFCCLYVSLWWYIFVSQIICICLL